jgi:hypothetical protein
MYECFDNWSKVEDLNLNTVEGLHELAFKLDDYFYDRQAQERQCGRNFCAGFFCAKYI